MSTSCWTAGVLLGTLLLTLLCQAQPAEAEELEPPVQAAPTPGAAAVDTAVQKSDDAAPASGFVSSQNIEDKLKEARQSRASLFDFGFRDDAQRLEKRLYRATR